MAATLETEVRGAFGRMAASVLFGLAGIESEYRRERQAVGIAVAKDQAATAAGGRARPRPFRAVLENSAVPASQCKRFRHPW
jgi:hypothetical protein